MHLKHTPSAIICCSSTMGLKFNFRFTSFILLISSSSSVLVCFLVLAFSTASINHISDDVFDSHGCAGGRRSLLQIQKNCPVNLEFLNYTIMTEQCKAPKYPPDQCCPAFKKLACPISEELNDLNTDCATVLFNYIYLNGHYPPGLFAHECREGKQGLDCTNFTSPPTGAASHFPLQPLTLFPGFIILLPLLI